jgi:hypothetical protein
MCDDRYRYILLPGGEVPNWFSHKRIGSNSISFQIPSLPKGKIKGLFLCAIWAPLEQIVQLTYSLLSIKINNRPLEIRPSILVEIGSNHFCGDHSCIMYVPNPFTEDEIASGKKMTISWDIE